jgi:hypothetical protein
LVIRERRRRERKVTNRHEGIARAEPDCLARFLDRALGFAAEREQRAIRRDEQTPWL